MLRSGLKLLHGIKNHLACFPWTSFSDSRSASVFPAQPSFSSPPSSQRLVSKVSKRQTLVVTNNCGAVKDEIYGTMRVFEVTVAVRCRRFPSPPLISDESYFWPLFYLLLSSASLTCSVGRKMEDVHRGTDLSRGYRCFMCLLFLSHSPQEWRLEIVHSNVFFCHLVLALTLGKIRHDGD